MAVTAAGGGSSVELKTVIKVSYDEMKCDDYRYPAESSIDGAESEAEDMIVQKDEVTTSSHSPECFLQARGRAQPGRDAQCDARGFLRAEMRCGAGQEQGG